MGLKCARASVLLRELSNQLSIDLPASHDLRTRKSGHKTLMINLLGFASSSGHLASHTSRVFGSPSLVQQSGGLMLISALIFNWGYISCTTWVMSCAVNSLISLRCSLGTSKTKASCIATINLAL